VHRVLSINRPEPTSLDEHAFYVDALDGDDVVHDGTAVYPFQTVDRALAATRAVRAAAAAKSASASNKNGNGQRAGGGNMAFIRQSIVLKAGVHYLNATIALGHADSGTVHVFRRKITLEECH
jgi:hypothetical protein